MKIMRVFFAITFYEETKDKLLEYKNLVASNSIKGKFTDKDNLHLTLEFIGEVDEKNLKVLISILHRLQKGPINLVTSDIGSFKRGNKEIIWLGIKKNEELIELQRELKKLLVDNKFKVDDRKYTPHITIGRQIIIDNKIKPNKFESIEIPIRSIAIMESKRVNEKLVYEPLEEIILQNM